MVVNEFVNAWIVLVRDIVNELIVDKFVNELIVNEFLSEWIVSEIVNVVEERMNGL